MPTVREIIARFEQQVPKKYAMGKDPIGLHFGDWNKEVTTVMTTLDIRPEVVDEAINRNVDLIIAHHPPIFMPIKQFDVTNPQIKMYEQLIKHDIAVYAAHTNLDVVPGGLNDWLAEQLQLQNTEVLSATQTLKQYKIAVFVPEAQAEVVRKAMHQAGAGCVGDCYKECSYTTHGVGRFTPTNGAKPTIGTIEHAEQVAEDKLEMICCEDQIQDVVQAMITAHPYEVPAYEIWPLESGAQMLGIGRIGDLPAPMSEQAFLEMVKEVFQLDGLRYVSSRKHSPKIIQKVAVCGGSGGSFLTDVIAKGVDAYITGDITYHTAHDFQESSVVLVDAGHHIEVVCIPELAKWLRSWNEEKEWNIEVLESQVYTNPFEFM